MEFQMRRALQVALCLSTLLGGCQFVPHIQPGTGSDDGDDKGGKTKPTPEPVDPQAQLEQLGKDLFEDKHLSANCDQSCASCHGADSAFTGNDNPDDPTFPVASGSGHNVFGGRNVPSAMYGAFIPKFGFTVANGRATPSGGLFWDGRANDLSEQAQGPFLNPREMGMASKAAVIDQVKAGEYAKLFKKVFGKDAFDDADKAYVNVSLAIEAYEETNPFQPFTSKFDAVLRGQAQLNDQEAQGFALFKDTAKANCVGCHNIPASSQDPQAYLFTAYAYRAIGVPRNNEITDNAVADYFDMGLCQQSGLASKLPPEAGDAATYVASTCGEFRVPTLRNVAKTAPYMHNGKFTTLHEVVSFYATRETNPENWYGQNEDGSLNKYDDLPTEYKSHISSTRVPFDLEAGDAPRLGADDIDAIVAFLNTLTDGYAPEVAAN